MALTACAGTAPVAATRKEPVVVEKVDGSDLKRMTLDARAVERIGLEIGTIDVLPRGEGEPERTTVAYGAVLYDAKGTTFVYTNPEPLVFLRQPVVVDFVEGATAVLRSGPAPATPVVTVGGSELIGIEFGVGK